MESMDDDVKKVLISLAQILKWIEQVKNLTINVQVERDSEMVSEPITETDYCVKG
jgi:hypothetical protein